MADSPKHSGPRCDVLDERARRELVERHLDLVGRVVGRMRFAPRADFDRDDLMSAGMVGLMTAARTFEPGRGASFRTFAYMAIRAAVLDELRRYDPVPRGLRKRLRALRELDARWRVERGRPPLPEEIAAELGLSEEEALHLVAEDERERLLASARFDPAADEAPDPDAVAPDERAASTELLQRTAAAIEELPEREKQVVVLYHAEGLLLREIGALLGVTESRICQILASAHRRLRAALAGQPEKVTDA